MVTARTTSAQPTTTATPKGDRRHRSTPTSLTERDASLYDGFSVDWHRKARREGFGPAFIRCGRTIRYRAADLDAWIDAHRVEPRANKSAPAREGQGR